MQLMTSKILKTIYYYLAFTVCLCDLASGQSNIVYDIVFSGGRVIDPETKLDAVKNVGILNNRIAQISSETLNGKEMINISGLVLSPGFIDMHVHSRSNVEQEYELHDGLTTALELEWGIEFLEKWYSSRKGNALINYGASVCWLISDLHLMKEALVLVCLSAIFPGQSVYGKYKK